MAMFGSPRCGWAAIFARPWRVGAALSLVFAVATPALARDAVAVDPASLPAQPLPQWPSSVLARHAEKGVVASQAFVDSQGRSLLYRISPPPGVDPLQAQGVMIYFHGNNSGTQEEILAGFFPGVESYAHARGLVAIAVASPETRPPPQETVRQWYDEDMPTIEEFIAQRVPTHVVPDMQRIYFMGGSQGTCFLNDFLQEHGENYGGGFFGGCGCYNRLDELWEPSQAFRDGMKVFISSTADDFLHEYSWRGYGYWKHTLGLDTRGTLDAAGAHCATHWSDLAIALDWFTGNVALPEEPVRPHFSRVSAALTTGLAITSDGTVWQSTMRPDPDNVGLQVHELNRSDDDGEHWTVAHTFDGTVSGLMSDGDVLIALENGALLRSDDDGASFVPVPQPETIDRLFSNGHGGLGYLSSGQAHVSTNGGIDWDAITAETSTLEPGNTDVVATITNAPMLLRSYSDQQLYFAGWPSDTLLPVVDTAEGKPREAAWDGTQLWALSLAADNTPRLYRSSSPEAFWIPVTLPTVVTTTYSGFGMAVSALPGGEQLLHGAWWSGTGWISGDEGQTWARAPGLESAYVGGVVAGPRRVFYTNGHDFAGPLFRLDGVSLPMLFEDGFE